MFTTLTLLAVISITPAASAEPPHERGDLSLGIVGGVGGTWVHRSDAKSGTSLAAAANVGVFVHPRISIEADIWLGRNSLGECEADGSCFNHLVVGHRTLTAGARFQATRALSVFAGPSAVHVPSNVEFFDSQVTVGAIAAVRLRYPLSEDIALAGEARYLTYSVEDTAISNLAIMFGAELR